MAVRPLVVVPGDVPVQIANSPHLDRLREVADVRLFDTRPTSDAEQLARAQGAHILINSRGGVRWPGELLRQLPQLQFITTVSIGTDSIDLTAARELGIPVSNIPGRTAPVVAEHALALLLSAARRVTHSTLVMKQQGWLTGENIVLGGKRLGVIGAGAIGAAMIRLAKGINMQVQAWTFNPSEVRSKELGVQFVSLEHLLETSDAISIHVKLTDESRHLIGREELRRMKPGSLLVNTARGAVIDSMALVEALQSGHLAGAGLDVFESEPLGVDAAILACEHVVVTPHAADMNPEGRDLLNGGAVDNVLAFLEQRPRNVVNR